LVKSIETDCSHSGVPVPKQVASVGQWARSRGTSSLDVGIQIAGFGGNVGRSLTLPAASEVSFEGLRDAIECLVSEAVVHLNYDGVFVALDNIENLNDEMLRKLLITFRDTLFMIPRVWWF